MKQLIPKHKQKLYHVKWQDAHHNGMWMTHDMLVKEVNREMLIVENVGWIVYEDKKEIHIVSRRLTFAMEGTSEYGLHQRIPKTWILKRKLVMK